MKKLQIVLPLLLLSSCIKVNHENLINLECTNNSETIGIQSIGAYETVLLDGAIDVTIIKSKVNKVAWAGTTKNGKSLNISNRENALQLQSPNGCNKDLRVNIYTNQTIKNLEVSGESKLLVEPNLLNDIAFISASGRSEVSLQEKNIDWLYIHLTRGSSVITKKINNADISITGASSATFEHLNFIQGEISGASKLDTNSENLDFSNVTISDISYID